MAKESNWILDNPIWSAIIAVGTVTGIIFLIKYFKMKAKKIDIKDPSTNHNLLFIGDSITANTNSYAEQLKRDIPSIDITKIAVGGKRTQWMLDNSINDINSGKYSVVFILGGINDVYALTGAADAEKNLQAMYDTAHRAGSKVVGVTVPPTEKYSLYNDNYGQQTDELNNWIRNNPTLDFVIDLNSLMKNPDGSQNTSLFVSDNLHLNSDGHNVVAQEVEKTVFK